MEEVRLGKADLKKMLSVVNYSSAHEQLSGMVFGSMDELRMRVTGQRAATAAELMGDSVVAPTSMNEHNPTTMQPLGIVTEHHEDTLAIHFVDGRFGEDTAKLLGDVLSRHDMMAITEVGGHSRPTQREISNAAKTHGSSDRTRLKSKAGLNATGIEQHFMAESLIQYKRTLMLAGNPFHNLLPGFHKDSRFFTQNDGLTSVSGVCVRRSAGSGQRDR
jgi:hypothetical protein